MTRLSAPNALTYGLGGMVIGEAGFMLATVPLTIAAAVVDMLTAALLDRDWTCGVSAAMHLVQLSCPSAN